MLQFMERSTIYYLKQKGWTNVQIAEFTGHHRDTIARVLREDVDKQPKMRNRSSTVAVFDVQIANWLDKNLLVSRMLELARADVEHPYTGGETAFYDYVRKVRRARKQTPGDLALRFEGVPGEFLQIDWGEVRNMAFTKPELAGPTRYFFAARLKYSRFMYVSFHTDMREETLLRCLIACFQTIGGVPWVVVTDNMKTAVLGRNAQHEPVWNPAYQKLAVEFTFHPEACAPASGNQKGAVENLVKYVKGNFIAGRTFYDDADLAEQCTAWLRHVNTERPSDATGQEPVMRLLEEQVTFSALPATAQDYGFFDCVVVSREGLVAILHQSLFGAGASDRTRVNGAHSRHAHRTVHRSRTGSNACALTGAACAHHHPGPFRGGIQYQATRPGDGLPRLVVQPCARRVELCARTLPQAPSRHERAADCVV
jgi:transposase